jgi:diacylglycerol kinase family enzyme
MGGGFMISPESMIDDGILNVILCKPLTLFKRLRYLPVIEKGMHLHLPFINSLPNISNIKVSATKKVYAQIDGDLYYDDVFNITVLPKRYLFKY